MNIKQRLIRDDKKERGGSLIYYPPKTKFPTASIQNLWTHLADNLACEFVYFSWKPESRQSHCEINSLFTITHAGICLL